MVTTRMTPLSTGGSLRILLHDFGGYGFIAQLARWLAQHGHVVLHLRSGDLVGPQGVVEIQPGDPQNLRFDVLSVGRPFARYALHRRLRDEVRYGQCLGRVMAQWRPDIVLSANTPPFAQAWALRAARRWNVPLVNWVQDIFSEGAGPLAARLPWPLGSLALGLLRQIEYGAMRDSQAVIVISDSFRDRLRHNKVEHSLMLVQENWSPPQPAADAPRLDWAAAQGLTGRRLLLAAGTLGLKHDPGLLADLALALVDDPDMRVVVVSQGAGRDHLEAWNRERSAPLLLLDYQPAAEVSSMLAAAEIGLVLLTGAAGGMSVPSKVYTYAAAGLPILAAVPADNHVARLIAEQGLGLVVAPDDKAGFVAAARRLLADTGLRQRCAAAGRAFSARHGDIDRIGRRLEQHLMATIAATAPAPYRHAGLPAGPESDLLCALALGAGAGDVSMTGLAALDTNRLSGLAVAHRLVPLVARACQTQGYKLPEALRPALKGQTVRLMTLSALLLEVMVALEGHGIRALALKGPALSILLHGDPFLRPCGDIDLMVDRRDAVAAVQVLEKLGFSPLLPTPVARLVKTNKDAPYRRGTLLIELHWQLFDNPLLLNWSFEDLWAAQLTVPFGQQVVPTLSVRHYGVYLAMHGVRHGWQYLRWLADLVQLMADPERAQAILDQAATDRMVPVLVQSMMLARKLLGMPLPGSASVTSDSVRTRLLTIATRQLIGILHHPRPGPGPWVRRRLTERLILFLLCPDLRAVGMEMRTTIQGPDEVDTPALPWPLAWMRPLQRHVRRLAQLWRGGRKTTQAGSSRTNR